ncbi:MAG: hypothetical protein ACFB0D_25080 [Phormidesmis sp.]
MKTFSALRALATVAFSTTLSLVALPGLAGTIIIENPYERFPNRSSQTTTTTTTNVSSPSIPRPGFTASVAALPNGVYRAISPVGFGNPNQFPFQPERTLFTFRKLGNRIVGNLEYADRTLLACVSGTVEDNFVIGEAVTNQDSSFIFGQSAAPTPSLQLGDFVAGNRYRDSVLNLSGFRRIDTGIVAPPSACFSR